jgi:hypothetical protein
MKRRVSPTKIQIASFPAVTICLSLLALASGATAQPEVEFHSIPAQGEANTVEIHGVAAGLLSPEVWRLGTLHFLPDDRHPLIEPTQLGGFRNIYAPSIVETDKGWRVFYGAWDGVATSNDRIYSLETSEFLTFHSRGWVIDHGPFVHVCNVNAIREGDEGYRMVCTALIEATNLNKPVMFASPDGKSWNGSMAPYDAAEGDLLKVTGYEGFEAADINGMNCLLRDDTGLHLYFSDFKNFGKVFRATQNAEGVFEFEGSVLDEGLIVNDVKLFQTSEGPLYLMLLHQNRQNLFYSLSEDGVHWAPTQKLGSNLDEEDPYIVAIGCVRRGNRFLGYLYGAGAVPELNRNRIFARWLQRKVVYVASDGSRHEPVEAMGFDRQRILLPEGTPAEGHFEVYAEDGVTRLGEDIPMKKIHGKTFQMTVNPEEDEFESLLAPGLPVWEDPAGGAPKGWSVEEDRLVFSGEGSYLQLKDHHLGDFILRLEYRLPPAGNSGVYFHHPRSGLETDSGFEIQILDHHHPKYEKIKPSQFTGSLYAIQPPSSRDIHPAGEWNEMEVYCRDGRVRVKLNGTVINDLSVDHYPEARDRPRRGKLALQNHGSTLEFRNVRMNRLD